MAMNRDWSSSFFVLLALVLLAVAAGTSEGQAPRQVLMWQVQKSTTDAEFAYLKKAGVTAVQSFQIGLWETDEVQRYLDAAHRQSLKVFAWVGFYEGAGDQWKLDRDRLRLFVDRWKSHPALAAWHVFDEAAERGIPKAFQEETYRFIKSLDANNKVFLSWNGTMPRQYACCFSEDAFDLLDLHAYITDVPGARQERLLDQFRTHRRKRYPVFVTIRAFNGGRRPRLTADALERQYDFFFVRHSLTPDMGIYGWQLHPNVGIKDDPTIRLQFDGLMARLVR